MKSHNCLDCGRLLCSRLCDQPSASDLRWVRNFKANHRGLDPRESAGEVPDRQQVPAMRRPSEQVWVQANR